MQEDDWRQRLADAVQRSGRKLRNISIASSCGPGYLHDLLKKGKEPTLSRFLRICNELGVSLSEIALGVDLSQDQEKLLVALQGLSDEEKVLVLGLAEALARGVRREVSPPRLTVVPSDTE